MRPPRFEGGENEVHVAMLHSAWDAPSEVEEAEAMLDALYDDTGFHVLGVRASDSRLRRLVRDPGRMDPLALRMAAAKLKRKGAYALVKGAMECRADCVVVRSISEPDVAGAVDALEALGVPCIGVHAFAACIRGISEVTDVLAALRDARHAAYADSRGSMPPVMELNLKGTRDSAWLDLDCLIDVADRYGAEVEPCR